MTKINAPFLSIGNRGLISPKALARVDLDRTRMSAEVFNNCIGKTQGALTIRPGTKYFGSSLNDTGAYWIEFVAATDDVALAEITDSKMRIWLGSNSHNLSLLSRPQVDTVIFDVNDTGAWPDESIGGGVVSFESGNILPVMDADSSGGVVVSASSTRTDGDAWNAADRDNGTQWLAPQDTGWWQVDFGAGTTETIASYSVRAGDNSTHLNDAPRSWQFQGNHSDTGSPASWTIKDTGGDQTSWSISEKRTFPVGSPAPFRFYRFLITENNGDVDDLNVAEFELFRAASTSSHPAGIVLNAGGIGGLARVRQTVSLDTGDLGVEHALAIDVARGPVTIRVGSSATDDDYISEASLGTGFHNLAFTPSSDFYVTLQSAAIVDRIVRSVALSDTGTVEITAPWGHTDLDNIRFDQSADVVYVDCADVPPYKIERRGIGRSWSVVEYAPNNGPFLPAASSSAMMTVDEVFGNTVLTSDIPFFTPGHTGGLIRIFHSGQSGEWPLAGGDAFTDAVEVTGISDTGTASTENERRVSFSVSGTYSGEITIERSFDGPDFGFKPISDKLGQASDTGTFSENIDDPDDNLNVWYRARMSDYTSGIAFVVITYRNGGVSGIARITAYNSNTSVDVEILSRFSDDEASASWQEGFWSAARRFPSAVALHGGRLAHASGGNLFLSVADDYENFDDSTIGDAAPIIRTLGSGPVDNIFYLISKLRLIIGTAGQELALTSSSLDEPVTPSNSNARTFSTQGSANMRALPMDTKAIMVQRSKQRIFMIGPSAQGGSFGEYESFELTMLVPDLLAAGVASVAIQRQPDTRLHCVLSDGTVALLTYEPQEEVLCWTTWSTDGAVERAMVLPGLSEDAVYYHIRRTINGQTTRYLEKWAMESECLGDTGLSWLADCAASYSDTGRASVLTGFRHLAGESVVVWADDTGQEHAGKDLSPGYGAAQTLYTVDTGSGTVTLNEAVHHAVAGLPYMGDWKSTKLAFAAEAGTALAQMKRSDKIAFVLYKTHNRGIQFGSDTGHLDPLPQMIDGGAVVDPDKIFETFDQAAMPFPGLWDTDSRICLRGQAPRPMTVLAAVPTIATNEKA